MMIHHCIYEQFTRRHFYVTQTDKYINHQNPHQDHYQGKEKVLMTPIPDKRLATGAPRFPLKGNSLISTPESSQSGDHQPATCFFLENAEILTEIVANKI